MTTTDKLQARRAAYSALSSRLAHFDDREFRSVLKPTAARSSAWGHSYATAIGDSKVFVKRIPLTELEAANPWSTTNLFRLPIYYSYGVGSAGFGAWRELVGHIKTTNWVLEGATPSFPLLLHHRVLPRSATQSDLTGLEPYVKRWNSSRAIDNFMRARANAPTEIWLVLEHVPHEMTDWLLEHQSRVEDVVAELCRVTGFMREHGMVHFDLHFGNVVTDGESIHVVDFGLVSDQQFKLTKTEREFLERHRHYDLAESIACIGFAVLWAVEDWDETTRAQAMRQHAWLGSDASRSGLLASIIDNVDSLASGPLVIEPIYAEALRRYREVILYMREFLTTMRNNPRKNTRYDDDQVRGLLAAAGLPIE